MNSEPRTVGGCRFSARNRACLTWRAAFGVGAALAVLPAFGDGCFVFRWDKKTDINEPTQKAIIVYDAGREDLLLQVRYEGALEDFGWLIPLPSLPKVSKGSMQPFYELSQLTHRQFGTHDGLTTLGPAKRGGPEDVKVIEIKTVGAYEVSILSASNAGSLEHWLHAHGYSIPPGKASIIDEYIQKKWYFVAVRIQLDGEAAFKMVSGTSPKDPDAKAMGRKAVQKQLSSGELHPLLISFDAPQCVFPLRISAVGGQTSEVSVYVLSGQPLLDHFIFDQGTRKLSQRWAEWDKTRPQRQKSARESTQTSGRIGLHYQMENLAIPGGRLDANGRDWTPEDLAEVAAEAYPGYPPSLWQDYFYGAAQELLECLHVKASQIKACAREFTRLGFKDWYLTKQVWTFKPDEMHDLEFQPAIPYLAKVLHQPYGSVAATVLALFGKDGAVSLITACASSNSAERVNVSTVLREMRDERLSELLLTLFKDPEPKVRLRAVEAAGNAWDPKFIEPLSVFFHDKQPEVRGEAVRCLGEHEPPARIPSYVQLFKDPDPEVQEGALGVVSGIYWAKRFSTDPLAALDPAIDLLKSPTPRVRACALHLLWDLNRHPLAIADRIRVETAAVEMLKDKDQAVQDSALIFLLEAKEIDAQRGALLPLLGSPSIGNVFMALKALNLNLQRYGGPQRESAWPKREPLRTWDASVKDRLSSVEAAPLTTNQLALARLIGLKFLQLNSDAAAVDLALPMLKDHTAIVRRRAFDVLHLLSDENISGNDAAQWEQWWKTNRSDFDRRHKTPRAL